VLQTTGRATANLHMSRRRAMKQFIAVCTMKRDSKPIKVARRIHEKIVSFKKTVRPSEQETINVYPTRVVWQVVDRNGEVLLDELTFEEATLLANQEVTTELQLAG
jgi:hypothetical protein